MSTDKQLEDISSLGENPDDVLAMAGSDAGDDDDLSDSDFDCDMDVDCTDADLDAVLAGTDGDLSNILGTLSAEDEGFDNIDALLGITSDEALSESLSSMDKSYLFRNTH